MASANAADSAADQAETDKATAKAEYDQAVLDVATAKAHKEALESIAQFSEDAQNPITDLASKAAVLNELNDAKLAYQAALKASAAANIAQKATSDAAIAARAASDNIIAEAKKVALILDPSLPDSTDFVSYLNTYVTNNSAANLNASFFVDDTSTANVNESDLDGDGISNVKEISNARTETGKQEDTALKQQNIASTQKDKAAADQSEAAQSATNAQGDLNAATASRAIFDKSEQIADKLEQANTYASGADANAQAAQTAAAQAKAKSQVAAEKTTDGSLTDAEKIAQARLAANETHAEQVKAETSENSALGNFNLAFAALIAAYDVIGDPNSQLNSLTSAYTNMADAINAHSATDSKTVDSATNTGLETAETNAINAYDTAFKTFVADLETELDARVTNQDANTLQKDLILNAKSAVSDAFDSLKGSVESHATATKSAINAEVTADQAETNISNAIQTAVNAYQAEADASAKQAEADAAKASAVHDDNNAQTSNDASAIDTKIQSLTGSIQTRLATLENDLLANQNALGNDLYTSLKTQLDTLKAAVNAVDSKSTQITGDVSTAADAASTAAQNARSYADATVAGNDLATAKSYATQAATYAKEAQNQLNIAQAHRSKLLGVLNDATALEQGYTQLSNVIDAKVQLAQAEADVNSTPIAQDDAFSTDEDQSVNLNDHLLANDSRNDGQPVQILDVGTPNVGTIVKNAQGEYIFTPPQDYSGEVRFSYLITTDNGKIASANVVMTITSVNDAPIAVNDVASTINETSPVTINLLANDINVDAGDVLTVTSIGTQPVYGTLTILNNGVGGRVIYTPDPNNPILKALGDQEVKEDTFTYVVTDSFGVSSTGTTTVTIKGTNDLPTVSNTQLSVNEDVVHTFSAADFQAGFNDVDGDSLAAIRITQLPRIAVTDAQGVTTFIESGSLKLNGTAVTVGQEIAVNQIGNLTFQGAENYHGTVTLGWQASDGAVYDVNKTVFSENEAVLTFNVNSVNDPVVIASGSLGGSTAEDTVFTGTLTATDVDGDSLTYSVDPQSLPANGNVTINPATGQFTYTPNPNYNGSDSFVVMVSDGQGSTDSRTVNVYVSPVNDAPTDISLDKLTVDENADGAVIGVLSSIDPDSGNESFTYTVSDSRFEVVGSQLKLKAGQVLNYENPADQNISLSVTTQDSGGLTYSENFTISTQNQNEAPTDIILSNLNVAEDTDGAVVGQLSAIDPDNAQETFTYTVDDPRFEVIGNELKLKAGYTLDYENPADQSFQINITAQDSGGLTYSESFTISTQNGNDAPTDIILDNLTVYENADGAVVGQLSATDPDNAQEIFTYTVDDSRFEVVGDQLKLKSGYTLDYENPADQSFQVTVTAQDSGGLTYSESFTISTQNQNDAPNDIILDNLTVDENADGAVVGQLSATDPDNAQETFTYTVDDSRFEVVGDQLKLKSGYSLDYENPADQSFQVTVTAQDSGGLTYSESFTISTQNQNEAPTDIILSNLNVAEDTDGAVVGQLSAIDPDNAQEAFTYTVDDPRFEVVGNELKLKAGYTLDYENPADQSFQINVTAQDSAGLTYTETFTLNTQNTLDMPMVSGLASEVVSLSFDGVSTIVDVGRGNGDSLELTDDLTLETWVKFNQVVGDQTIVAFGGNGETSSTNIAYQLYLDATGDIHYKHEYGAGLDVDLSFDTNLTQGNWHHLAVVRDNNVGGQSDVTLYVDGVSVGTLSYDGASQAPASAADATMTVGNTIDETSPLNGEITEARIWSDIRSESEIQTFMKEVLPQSEISDPTLRGYWDFAGLAKDDSEYLKDLSTYQNHIVVFDGLHFDGSVTATSYSGITLAGHSASVWARVEPISDGMTDGDVTVFSMNDGTSTLNLYLSTYGEITLDLTWAGGSHSWAVDSGAYPQFAGLDDGQWHNLGYSFDPASGVALFVDGQQVPSLIDSGTGDYSTFVIDSMVMIGGHSSNSALNMVGDLSELGIYNRVLTPAEMQDIVQNGPHGLSASDVAAYWHMDDGDGSYISYDSFGDMNDIDLSASISGTPVWINETPGLIDYPYQSVEIAGGGLGIGSYTFNSNEFSASMWVKLDDAGNGTELLMLGDGDITVTAYNDYIEVVVGNSIYATVYNAMEMGEWSNLSVTFDGNELKVYSGDNLFYNEPAASYYDLLGGLGSDTFGGILGGVGTAQFGAVQIWNSVLDQQDIMAISSGGVNPSDPNLLAYWPMTDDPATGMITDVSGHQNDVTLSASQFISGLPVLKTNATTIDLEEDDSFVSQILVENSEVYGDALSYQVQSQPQNGVVYINPDGSFVYVPNANYVGTDTFSVVAVNAGSLTSSPFTVDLNIVEHNAVPHVGFDTLSVLVNSSNNILNVLANDYDQDGDPLTITAIDGKTGPGPHMVDGGTVTLVNGDVTFTPAYNFTGTATFEYTVSDGQGGSHSNFVDVQVSTTINGTDASETLPAGSDADESFYAMVGDDTILGSGGNDYFDGGDGVDIVSYAGSTDGVHVDLTNMSQQSVSLSQGSDTFYSIENVEGSAFNDTLIGDTGANLLTGVDGDDTLTGGGGADILDGGTGQNLYIYSSATDSIQGAADVIKSLTPQDAIQFIGMRDMTFVSTSSTDAATFMAGGMAADTVYYVSVGSGDNFIYVNGAGTGTDYTGTFIVLDTGVPAPTAEQILADDYPLYVIQGTDGNETLTGDAAVNTLVGLLGNDTLQGADGDDHYIVSGGTDYVIDSVGINHIYVDEDAYFITNMEHTVSDEFQMSLSDGMGSHELIIDQHYTNTNAAFLHLLMDGQDNTYQIQTNVNIVPTVGSILVSDGLSAETLTGSSFDDILVGQTGDTLLGGGGYDFFVVNEGVVAVDGGDMASEDEVAFTGQTGGVLVDLENGFGKHSDGVNTFTISNVQNVTGSEYDDTIAGDLYDNYLWGYSGNDTLLGGDGNDTLEGGSGEDFLFGGNGNDVFEFFGSEDSDQSATDVIADFVSGEDKISIAQSAENMKFYGSYGFVDDPAITLSTIESDPKVEPGQIVWFYSDNAAFVYIKNDYSQNGGTFIALVGYQGELSFDDFIGVGDNVVVDATSDIYESGINQTVVVSAAEFLGNDKGAALQITHVNGLAIADLQANGLHDASGVLSYDGANFTFVPTNEFSGDIHFDVTVAGTGGTDQANLTIRYDEAIAIVGTSGDDMLGGSIYSDAMIGLDGDDQFYGGIGDDFIVGGGNTAVGDVAAYDQVSGDYSIGLRGSALVVRDDNLTDNDEGIDYLLGIEKIYFNDIAGSTPHGLSVTYEGDRTVDDTNVVADTVSEITYLSDGTYVTIHRQSSNDFLISRFNEDGTPFAGMPPFSIASGDAMPGETAMIQGLSNGSFAVVWSSSSGDILYQRFDTSGAAIDLDPFFVSDSLTETGLERPEMVTLASNDVVVSYIATDVNAGFYMRTLPGDDVEANMGTSVLLKSFNTVDETVSSLVALTGGGYAYAHTTDNLDGTYNIKIVVDNGSPIETDFAITTPFVDDLKVVELDNGNLLTVWKSELAEGFEQTTIKARIVGSDGSLITDTNVIGRDVFDVNFNSMDGGDYSPDVAVLSNGNFVVVWTDLHEDGDGGAIFGQIFDQDGNSVGEDFLINATTQGNQYMPSVAANDNGTFVVSWTDEQTDSNTHRVMAQQFANDGSLASGVTIAGDGTVDVFVGGDGKQVFVADIGNDSIDGGLGRDGVTYASFTEGVNVDLGAGQATTSSSGTDELISIEGIIGTSYNDTLIGDIESNKLNGMAGDDLIKGGLGDDYLIGGVGTDTVSFELAGSSVSVDLSTNQATGEGNDIVEEFENVIGSMYADVINGDISDNMIEGGDGDDMISGGAGNDILIGGSGLDTLDGGAGNDYFVFNDMTEFGDLISTFESGDAVKLSSIIDGLNGLSGSDWATEGFEFGIHTVTDVGEGAQLSGSGPSIYVYANTGDDSGTIYYDADGAGASYTSTKIADIGTGATSITADAIKITY